ncbi:DUF5693 family protein [Cohnella thailandensis]|uniref:Sulfite exporter TauE/SafE family protein n=1 Tax=Cohnella thailandensis TaxID=557557 RepID=A0A841T1T1_9BACL|nr:DUF5693 family protein [Cohnella thailandensis]MBB6638124.1 sulfite exporter TauE/SafE family protein [Cohnella thailandensis]MBP1971949.1 hypothetical protein [Cohnella thailandensis]
MTRGVDDVPQWMEKSNRRLAKGLWWAVLIGLLGSLPFAYTRIQTEASSKKVEFVMDYRDIVQMSQTQPNPQSFVTEQIKVLKDAGVNAMAVYESSLEELSWEKEVTVYNAQNAALLEGKLPEVGDNRTYLLFNNPENVSVLRPMIEKAFARNGIPVSDWSFGGREGLLLDIGPDDAYMRPLPPNPIKMQMLKDEGFLIVPRLSDHVIPYNDELVAEEIEQFKALGVSSIIFDGDAVTGFADQADEGSLDKFAARLKEAGIGIGAIENLKIPQKGLGTLANLLDYNVMRVHSISEGEMNVGKPETLADRILLAVKDRNLRLIFLNASASKDASKGQITNSIGTVVETIAGDEDEGTKGAIEQIEDFGFKVGEAHSFDVHRPSAEKLWKAFAIFGSVALIAATIGLYLPKLLTLVTVIGAIGGAGVLVLDSSLLNQALALFTAIAAPTASLVLLLKWLRAKHDRKEGLPQSAWGRVGASIVLYVRTAVLSLVAVPFVIAILSNITYNLVLEQFRGVSLLHLAPIALVALYAVLYGYGGTVRSNFVNLMKQPITVLWVVLAAIVGAMGMYYLSRTGNAGQASGLELQFRSFLETTFGVRPRTKEFLLGHPLLILGLFLSLKYRWGIVFLVAATLGQLSMVDTFAHLHTPIFLSATRDLLGLGIGLVLGLIAIAVWQVLEKVWRGYRANA